jgi:hypothetical protein
MRRMGWVGLTLVAFGGLLGASCGDDSGIQSGDETGSALGVLNAGGGTFEITADGSYRVTLTDVPSRAVVFGERPARFAGTVSSRDLADAINAGDDPPNGALEVYDGTDDGDVVVVTIANARFDAAAGRLVFEGELLGADEVRGTDLQAYGGQADSQLEATFEDVALFIDDLDCITYSTDDEGVIISTTECVHMGPGTGGGANENTGQD